MINALCTRTYTLIFYNINEYTIFYWSINYYIYLYLILYNDSILLIFTIYMMKCILSVYKCVYVSVYIHTFLHKKYIKWFSVSILKGRNSNFLSSCIANKQYVLNNIIQKIFYLNITLAIIVITLYSNIFYITIIFTFFFSSNI